MSQYSPFGQFCRRTRREHRTLLIPMADGIGVKPDALSRAELGESQVPDSWIPRIKRFFTLSEFDANALDRAARRSNEQYKQERMREVYLSAAFQCSTDTHKDVS